LWWCRFSGRTAFAPTSRAGLAIPVIFDLVQEEFKRGYYRGVGEFHLSGKSAENELVKKTVDSLSPRSLSARPMLTTKPRDPDAATIRRRGSSGA